MKTRNLFISHSWKYGDAYEKLVGLLNGRGYFDFKNYSVPNSNPIYGSNSDNELKEAIENKMKHSSVVLILAGVYSSYSKWINIEISIAKRLNKPIIAIEPWASEKTSLIVKNSADKTVKWQCSSIVSAIQQLS